MTPELPLPHPRAAVAVTTLNAGDLTMETFDSWDDMVNYDIVGENAGDGCQHILVGGRIKIRSGPRVAEGRTQLGTEFIKLQSMKPVHWMLCIDSDMDFDPDALCQLLGHAYGGDPDADPDQPECHIIGGLCFAGGYEKSYPTIYRSEIDKGTGQVVPEPVLDYPRDQLVKCAATGGAFLLVHRNVLAHMAKPYPDGFGTDSHGQANPHPWWVEGQNAGIQFGEDVAFCLRANALGYATYVHTGVKIGHMKRFRLDEKVYDEQRERAVREKAKRIERERLYSDLVVSPSSSSQGATLILPPQPKVGA